MPELPEVETVARQLSQSEIVNSPIDNAFVFWNKTISCGLEEFHKKILGRKILSVTRRGKYLIFHLDAPYHLLAHLRMSGQFYIRKNAIAPQKHEHVVFTFSSGASLHFHDPRKFGRMYVTDDLPAFFSHLGIEPLSEEFSFENFCCCIERARAIKSLLLDQSIISGLGNIYHTRRKTHSFRGGISGANRSLHGHA